MSIAKDKFGRVIEVGDSVLYIARGKSNLVRLDKIKSLSEDGVTCILESSSARANTRSMVEVNDISFELSQHKGYGEGIY